MDRRAYKERTKGAYQRLLDYELQQYLQEQTRESLGAPYGRAPPIKLYHLEDPRKHHASSSELVGSRGGYRSFETERLSLFTDGPLSSRKSPRANKLDPLQSGSLSARALATRGKPLPQFPSTSKPLSYSFQPSDVLLQDSEYQFSAPSHDEIDSFNPFQRPQADDYFFPPDMFFDEDLAALSKRLPVSGFGKWRKTDGTTEWRPCEVAAYSDETHCFEVVWNHSNARQALMRWNVLLEGEDPEEVERKLSRAKQLRVNHEGFVRYFGRFELALAGTVMQKNAAFNASESSILSKLSVPLRSPQIAQVRAELWELYRRSCFKFIFDSQYFYEKVQLAACPWESDYRRQTKWRKRIRKESAGHLTFTGTQKAVLEKYLNPRNQLDGPRQRMYRMLTVLRNGNYFASLRELRSRSDTLTPYKLNYEFRDRFAKDLRRIDTTIKQITDSLGKMLEESKLPDFDQSVDRYLEIANVVLESNLQYAIRKSAHTLAEIFAEYQPMIPLPEKVAEGLKVKKSGTEGVASMTLLQSTHLMKEVIRVLEADFQSGALLLYSLESPIPPLMAISIESKLTRALLDSGHHVKHFHIKVDLQDRTQRRSKEKQLERSSSIVIQQANQSLLFSRLMLRNDECALESEDSPLPTPRLPKSLLREEIFGWVSVGVDSLNLVLLPSIEEIDQSLRTLAKAPLKNLQRIRKLKRNATENEHIAASNAKDCLSTALRAISTVLQFSLYGPVALLAILRHFEYLFTADPQQLFDSIVSAHIDDYEGLVKEIETISTHKDEIELNLPMTIQFGLFQVHLITFKTEAVTNATVLMEKLLAELSLEHLGILREVHQSFEALMETLSRSPDSVESLGDLQDFLTQKKDDLIISEIYKELDKVQFITDCLDRFNTAVSVEQNLLWWKTKFWRIVIRKEKARLQKRLQKLIPSFRDSVQRNIGELKAVVETLKTDIIDFVTYNDVQKADVYAGKAADIMEALKQIKTDITLANSREKRLGLDATNFAELAAIEDQFLVYNALWSFANEWSLAYMGWMDKPLHFIDPNSVKLKFKKGKDLLERLKADLHDNPNSMNAIIDLDTQLRAFESTVPLITNLRDDALRDRHWKRIWDSIGRSSADKPDSERKEMQTLRELLLQGILKHIKDVEAITFEARNEYEIEKIWMRIEKEVKNPSITVESHPRFPELQILAQLEDTRDSLQESCTTINYLVSANRYIDPFRDTLKNLISMITAQKTMIDDVCEFQSALVELYPVFKIAEVSEQQARTATQMQELVAYYARQLKFMQDVSDMQNRNFATSNESYVKTLADASRQLKEIREDVQKKLAEKQSLNSRLYFLSNMQILMLMSSVLPEQTVDVEAMFPGVQAIVLGEKYVMKVVRNQETVDLPRKVVVFQESGCPRSTEEWLADLDASLKDFHAKRVLAQYRQFATAGFKWEAGADYEAVYIAYLAWFSTQMKACFAVENVREALVQMKVRLQALLSAGIAGMKPSHGTPGHGVVATIVRQQFLRRDESLERRKYNEMLAHLLISHIDFLSQVSASPDESLKLQWKSAFKLIPALPANESAENIAISIDCFDYVTPFGFEMHSLNYLQSFILTPTSERRLLHVFLTMKHGLGCMLSGAPGSEKTETLKHLALVCGRLLQLCFITTNTEQEKVVKFIVGCALGGFWGCIDEIHSLAEVSLCTVLNYVRQISIAAGTSPPPRVMIDGYFIKPKLGFAMFSTSSVQSRVLPKSFHEQFRTLAVTKPDLSTIAAILLQTYGFEKAGKYGSMIAKAMELLELPILSFSTGTTINLFTKANTRTLVRLVRSMIDIAMKHYINDMQYLINNAFRQVYGLGLLAADLSVLDEYLSTLFQSIHNDIVAQLKSRSISDQIQQIITQEKLVAEEAMQRRCQHLWWLLYGSKRPWVLLVGEPLCGKSAIVRTFARVIAHVQGANFNVHKLGAAAPADTLTELYEHLANSENPWFTPNPMASFLSEPALPGEVANTPTDWVHVDAYSYPYTADTLFTLIKTHPKAEIRLIFETERLESASPSVMYEAGVLFVEDSEIDLPTYFRIRMQQILPPSLLSHLPLLERLYPIILQPVMNYLATNAISIRLTPKLQIQQFSNIFKTYLHLVAHRLQNEEEMEAIPLAKKGSTLLFLKKNTHLPAERKGQLAKNKSIAKNPDIKANVLRYLGAVRKTITRLQPHLCIEAMFVVSALHSLGRLAVNSDSFTFVIAAVIARQAEDFAYYLQREIRNSGTIALLDLVFSLKTLNWRKVTAGEQVEKDFPRQRPAALKAQPDAAPSVYESAGLQLNIFSLDLTRSHVLVNTESSKRLSFWVEFCLTHGVDFAVLGPHQCGKSLITMSVAKDLLSRSPSALIPFNVSEFSTAAAVQESVQMSLEHYRRNAFGGLGGMKYFAVLDDMNMDASFQLYDLLRYWKEMHGWYGLGFVSISDLTVALVHSYTEGKSRPLWFRALRHFFLLHKESYLNTEITTIFRAFVDTSLFDDIEGANEVKSIVEESMIRLVSLFHDLQLLHNKSEQYWCHISISNFVLALRFLSQFDVYEEMPIPTYLKLWTFMYTRFLGDQFGDPSSAISRELQETVNDNLSSLISQFCENDDQIREVYDEGFVMPTAEAVAESNSGTFHEFELMNEDNVAEVVTHFHASHKVCVKMYPQLLKWLHSLIFQIETRSAVFYYLFLSLMYDIRGTCSSLIIKSESQLSLVKAILYISAEALKIKIVDFTIAETDDSFSEHMIESFRSVSPHHIPTEIRYAVKHIIEQAMIQNKRTVILVTLVDPKQLDRPLSHRMMELFNDIMTGVQLRLTGFSTIYREFIDQFRAGSDDPSLRSEHYNEQILQMMLDRMRMNTTIVFLVESENESWIRSPLHSIGVLEKFKHEYRSIFNKSRIVDFDHLQPPKSFIRHLVSNMRLLRSWKLDFHNELLLEIGKTVAELLQEPRLNEFTYECVIFCSSRLMQEIADRRKALAEMYKKALRQIEELDKAVEESPSRVSAMEEETKKLEATLTQLREKKSRLEVGLAKELAYDYAAELQEELHEQRLAVLDRYTEAKEAWLRDLSSFEYKLEDVREAEKSSGQPLVSQVLSLFSTLVASSDPAADSAEPTPKKFLSQLAKRHKDIGKRLRKLEAETIPDLTAPLESIDLSSSKVPKLIRTLLAVIHGSQQLKAAHIQFLAETDRIETSVRNMGQLVEAKITEKKSAHGSRMAKLHGKMTKTQDALMQVSKVVDQITTSRPKLQKFVIHLKKISDPWSEFIASGDPNAALGDCILSSFLLLKGMRQSQEDRVRMMQSIQSILQQHQFACQATTTLAPRLILNSHTFGLGCVCRGLPDSHFFTDNVAGLQTLLRLKLPFPLFYDPYEIASDYILKSEADSGLLVGKVSNDIVFERKLKECIAEGKPVLCIDPSISLFNAILPILSWRSQFFVAYMRHIDTSEMTFSSVRGPVKVHPDFRLYISSRTMPSQDLRQLTTFINFDAYDKESWESFTFGPLLKLLDEAQYQHYAWYLGKQYEQALAGEAAESEVISLLTTNDMKTALSSESLLDSMFKIWRNLKSLPLIADEFGTSLNRRPSMVIKEKSSSDLRSNSLSLDIRASPKDKMKRLLSEMFDFKQTLNICNVALKDYAVPEKLLFMTITNSVHEYIRTIAVPLESQWEGFAECMAYRVFVRISHSLPKDKRLTFAAFYTFYKHYSSGSVAKTEYLQILEDIAKANHTPAARDENIKFLKEKYSKLFTPHFGPGTSVFHYFLTRNLYQDAKLPDSLEPIYKYLLYSLLRADLLPDFIASVAPVVLGQRFSWIPQLNFDNYTGDTNKVPMLLFFDETSPLPLLRYMAEARKITLISTQPLLESTMKTGRSEIRKVGRAINPILSTLKDNFGSSRWLTIENLQCVTGLEAEVLTKFLVYKVPEEAGDNLRIWLVFQGKPEDHPQWTGLLKQCQRVVMPEPISVREEMLMWHYTNRGEFYVHYRDFVNKRYWRHCALEGTMSPMKSSRSMLERKKTLMEYPADFHATASAKAEMEFNVGLLFSILYYRNRFHPDLPDLWKRADARRLLEDYLTCLPEDVQPAHILNPANLRLFCQLLAPQFDSYGIATIVGILKHIFQSRHGVFTVKARDEGALFADIEYPLFSLEHSIPEHNLEILLNRYPTEDHLQVAGLKHYHAVPHRMRDANDLLRNIGTLQQALGGDFRLSPAASLASAKPLVSDSLQNFLNELLSAMPSFVPEKTITRERPYMNSYTKSGHSYKAALAHTQDGFKLHDMRNSVLDDPPTLSAVLEVLEAAEAQMCERFLSSVKKTLVEMNQYLAYARSTISQTDMHDLALLAKNRVPKRWLALSPYVCRRAATAEYWKQQLVAFFAKKVDWQQLDLTALFEPSLALDSVIRAAAVTFGKHFHKLGFFVQFNAESPCDPTKYQLKVSGLYIANGGVSAETGLLEDRSIGEVLPVCTLTPGKLPKGIRRNCVYPEGLKLLVNVQAKIEKKMDISAVVNGMLRRRPGAEPIDALDLACIYVPVDLSQPPLWLLVPSSETEAHWSKKGTHIRLQES